MILGWLLSHEARGKHGTFFNAWKMSADFLQCVESARHETISARSRKRLTAFKGIFRLIEGGFSVSGIITPLKVFERF